MAWEVSGNSISMAEGDFGVKLPMTISGTTFAASDSVKLDIKSEPDGEAIVSKEFTNIQQNTVNIELTEAESALLPVGNYVYVMDWYQSGVFMCNIITKAAFKVVDKA